jgi:hypothetical protein
MQVCFDALLHDLVIYRCVGYEGCLRGDSYFHAPVSDLRFDRCVASAMMPVGKSEQIVGLLADCNFLVRSFSRVHYRRLIAQGAENLNKDFCLASALAPKNLLTRK